MAATKIALIFLALVVIVTSAKMHKKSTSAHKCPASTIKRESCSKGARNIFLTDVTTYWYKNRKGQCVSGINTARRKCRGHCDCYSTGNLHYRTFDQQLINYDGKCRVLLAESTKKGDGHYFQIFSGKEKVGHKLSTYIEIGLNNRFFRLGPGKQVHLDGHPITIPYQNSKSKYGEFIVYAGSSIDVYTSRGIHVSYDSKQNVAITINKQRYGGKLRGLCGNCDGRKNDFRTRHGKDVSRFPTATRERLIVASYMQPALGEVCKKDRRPIPVPRPTRAETAQYSKAQWCGLLKTVSGPWGECIKARRRDAHLVYKSCILDMVAFKNSPRRQGKLRCEGMKQFTTLCAKNQFTGIRWRNADLCLPKCPDNSHYSVNINPCPETCESALLSAKRKCHTLPHNQGCQCNKGYVLDGTKCIKPENCPCLSCVDNARKETCQKWKQEGMCTKRFEQYGMLMSCKKTCGFCKPKPDCEDYIASSVCMKALRNGNCKSSFYKKFCGLTCNWRNCPCDKDRVVKGKCREDGTRKVITYFSNRDKDTLLCVQEKESKDERCRTCIETTKTIWGRCNYCIGKKSGIKIETYKSGIRCLKRRRKTSRDCQKCRFPNGKRTVTIDRYCKGGHTWVKTYKSKIRQGCFKCKVDNGFDATPVECRKTPLVTTVPISGEKNEKLTICHFKLRKCNCDKSCRSIVQPRECQPSKQVAKVCVVWNGEFRWSIATRHERLIRNKQYTRCKQNITRARKNILCPKRLLAMVVKGSKCRLMRRITFYKVNNKCICSRVTKWKKKGYWCCPKTRYDYGGCGGKVSGRNVLRSVVITRFKLVRNQCVKILARGWEVCRCLKRTFPNKCKFGNLVKKFEECRLQRSSQGAYCKCSSTSIDIPIKCNGVKEQRITSCRRGSTLDKYATFRHHYFVKKGCHCLPRWRDYKVWCGCKKNLYKVIPCPKSCRDIRKCNSKCYKRHIWFSGVAEIKGGKKRCVRKIITAKKERCCCSPVVLIRKPYKKCGPRGRNWIHYTYRKRICRGKKSGLKECCVVRSSKNVRVKCKEGLVKTTTTRCNKGIFIIVKHYNKLSRCKCIRRSTSTPCRCKCPKSSSIKLCDKGKRVWRTIRVTYRKVKCACKRFVVTKEDPLNKCISLASLGKKPTRQEKNCGKNGFRKLYFDYEIRRGCICIKKVKVKQCRCRCSSKVTYSKWKCHAVKGIETRVMYLQKKRGCYCMTLRKTKSRTIRCRKNPQVSKICNRKTGLMLILVKHFVRKNCRCHWKVFKGHFVQPCVEPNIKPKEKTYCEKNNIWVKIIPVVEKREINTRIAGANVRYIKFIVRRVRTTKKVKCPRSTLPPRTTPCIRGRYSQLTPLIVVQKCRCKPTMKVNFKSCKCPKNSKRTARVCNMRKFAWVSHFTYQEWSHSEERCAKKKRIVSNVVRCSAHTTVTKSRCVKGLYKITTKYSVKDRSKCACVRKSRSFKVSCYCKPKVQHIKCNKSTCVRYVNTTRYRWNHSLSRCQRAGKPITRRIVCCCSKKVTKRTSCNRLGIKTTTIESKKFVTFPIPNCKAEWVISKVHINCKAAKHFAKLLKNRFHHGYCKSNGFKTITQYSLRLNVASCHCEKYVFRKFECRCRCRKGERFERKFCKRGSHTTLVKVYSSQKLKQCKCWKRHHSREETVTCRKSAIRSYWSKCNRRSCYEHRVYVKERAKRCKCELYKVKKYRERRRCCCNQQIKRFKRCTKYGWLKTWITYRFNKKSRSCTSVKNSKYIRDNKMEHCNSREYVENVRTKNCVLLLYRHKFYRDYVACKCRHTRKASGAGKYCCNRAPRIEKNCRHRQYVYTTTTQKLRDMRCVDKVKYRKEKIPCVPRKSKRGKCNEVTGYAMDIVGEAHVLPKCICRKNYIYRKRRCSCPKPEYITNCLRKAGILEHVTKIQILKNEKCILTYKRKNQPIICPKQRELKHESKCGSDNRKTLTYRYYKREDCDCVKRFHIVRKICRCKPQNSKKKICKKTYWLIKNFMHFVNQSGTKCLKRLVTTNKKFKECWGFKVFGKCVPEGQKGRMVQTTIRVVRKSVNCKCITVNKIIGQRICHCPDPHKQKGQCSRSTERLKVFHYSYTLNRERTSCKKHTRRSTEVCYCNKRPTEKRKCDTESGNIILTHTHRYLDRKAKKCVVKTTTDIEEVDCAQKIVREKTDCTASGIRTDIIRTYFKDFDSCKCRNTARPIKIRCECVPSCNKLQKVCTGKNWELRQRCYKLTRMDQYINKCIPYRKSTILRVRCNKKTKYDRYAPCVNNYKVYYKKVYVNINCKCRWVKKLHKKVLCRCPKGSCWHKCMAGGRLKYKHCKKYTLHEGVCDVDITKIRVHIDCPQYKVYWTKCNKVRIEGIYYKCTVWKKVVYRRIKNCVCVTTKTKNYERKCCCPKKQRLPVCNKKTGVITITKLRYELVGEGFCKKLTDVTKIPSPLCHGQIKGKNLGSCNKLTNKQQFVVWVIYRKGCICAKRKTIQTTDCECHTKPGYGYIPKCKERKGYVLPVVFYYVRVKFGKWRYRCVKKSKTLTRRVSCSDPPKPKIRLVCRVDRWVRFITRYVRIYEKIRYPHGTQYIVIRIPVITERKSSELARKVICPRIPSKPEKCNNFKKRFYMYYYKIKNCDCKLQRWLRYVKACDCHKKDRSSTECDAATNHYVRTKLRYHIGRQAVCIRKETVTYYRNECRTGHTFRDRIVVNCHHGRSEGLSRYHKVRYYQFHYDNCKCKKRFLHKWELCGCRSKAKKEVCRNGKWFSTLYTVVPDFELQTCKFTERYQQKEVHCKRNARLSRIHGCNSDCRRKYVIRHTRFDAKTCSCVAAKPMYFTQVCGCYKCPDFGRTKVTVSTSCIGKTGTFVTTTVKSVFSHNGNLFNNYDIVLPRYKCKRLSVSKKRTIVCTRGSSVVKEECDKEKGIRYIYVKRQVRVGCRCRTVTKRKHAGRCSCKGLKPKPDKVWKTDSCNRAPFFQRITTYYFELDKSDKRNWKCKLKQKIRRRRCGCPKKVHKRSYCDTKGSIIMTVKKDQFNRESRSCVSKTDRSLVPATCPPEKLSINNMPPTKYPCNKRTGYMQKIVKKWYEVDPKDCKCKLRRKTIKCPCSCSHKNKDRYHKCEDNKILKWVAFRSKKNGCACVGTKSGKKKYIRCKHEISDVPERVENGECDRSKRSPYIGYVKVNYIKEYASNCKCKRVVRPTYEPCDCSLIASYKSKTSRSCDKSGKFFLYTTTYYVVVEGRYGQGTYCQKKRRYTNKAISNCFDRNKNPLKRVRRPSFEKCSRKRTACKYFVLFEESVVKNCKCIWRTVKVERRKCCCPSGNTKKTCEHNILKVLTTTSYQLTQRGQCKKVLNRKPTLLTLALCKYKNRFLTRCTKKTKSRIYQKYYPHLFKFHNCKCRLNFRKISVPCRCLPKKIVRKPYCDVRTKQWVHVTIYRKLKGRFENIKCINVPHIKRTKSCSRKPSRVVMLRCNKKTMKRKRITYFQIKKGCQCINKSSSEYLSCQCPKTTSYRKLINKCTRRKNGRAYYPRHLMGYIYIEKTHKCKLSILRTDYVICGCPKPRKTRICRGGNWRHTKYYYQIRHSKNTCETKHKRWSTPVVGCGLKARRVKVIEEYVDEKTGYKHITYLTVYNQNCICVHGKEEVIIEWDCEVILENKKIKRVKISCWKGKKIIERAGKPYLDKEGHCVVDYSKTVLSVRKYCPRNGTSKRINVGSCNSKTGKIRIQVSRWKANKAKCRCDRRINFVHEICDCEPIHPSYVRMGCRHHKTAFKSTYKWYNEKGVCVLDKSTVETDIDCKVGRFETSGPCSQATGYKKISVVMRKLQNCKCIENKRSYSCKCRCDKPKQEKYCIHKSGLTRVRTTKYTLTRCTCKKNTKVRYHKPPPPCGRVETKRGRCIRSTGSSSEISGYSRVKNCKAIRKGCECRMKCKTKKKLCYCSPDITTKTRCIGHTLLQISTLNFVANYRANKCEWVVSAKSQVRKDCFGMFSIPDTKDCNKKTGILVIKHWKYQPVNCKCTKKVYKVTRGRCRCNNVWRKVGEGRCDTTTSCTKKISYERKVLRGIRCIRERKHEFVKCSCACEIDIPKSRECNKNTGAWETTLVSWKLKCGKNTDSCKCEKHNKLEKSFVECSKRSIYPYCNKKTGDVNVEYRKDVLRTSKCECESVVYKRVKGKCFCPKVKRTRTCEASKRRIKITTYTYTLDDSRWTCLVTKTSNHVPVRPSCTPSKYVRNIKCDSRRDMQEHKVTTIRWLDPITCECKSSKSISSQPCKCPTLPKIQRYSVICDAKNGKLFYTNRWLALKKDEENKNYCKLVVKTRTVDVDCGISEWQLYGQSKCNRKCNILLKYRRKIRSACKCIYAYKQKLGKCCCPKTALTRDCSNDGKRLLFRKTVYAKVEYQCISESRRWSKTIVCQRPKVLRICNRDGKEKITTIRYQAVGCKCMAFKTVSWCVCKCRSSIKEDRCEIESRFHIVSRTFFKKKGCQCDHTTTVSKVHIDCQNENVEEYKPLGKCNFKTRKQAFLKTVRTFNGELCKCITKSVKIFRTCACKPTGQRFGKCDTRNTCMQPVIWTRYRFSNWKCIGKSITRKAVCCCKARISYSYSCNLSKGYQIKTKSWYKMINSRGQRYCKQYFKNTHRVFYCNIKKVIYKDTKCKGSTYKRTLYRYLLTSQKVKGKKGDFCICVKHKMRTVTRFCRCPRPKTFKSSCQNDNEQVYSHVSYRLQDGECTKTRTTTIKVLRCPTAILKRFEWSKCDKRTCKQRKYGSICYYKNCRINVKVDYANPKIFDCCCQSEKAKVSYLECRDKKRLRVYKKFWQVYDAKNMKCNNFVKNIYTRVKCEGPKSRQVFPGKCVIKGSDGHFYQNVKVFYERYEEGCICTKKKYVAKRLCKCKKPRQIKICRKDGVKVFKNIRFRLQTKSNGNRKCVAYVHKTWIELPGCVKPSVSKWKKFIGKCNKGIRIITDRRKILIGCACISQEKRTKVICSCPKKIDKITRCHSGRWVTTSYGHKLVCRSERFCQCVSYKTVTRHLPDCPKGYVKQHPCVKGFRKVEARLYTVKKCECHLREFKEHRRCPKPCQDLVASRRCKEILKEGLCEHPQRQGLASQICPLTCGKCIDCPHPNEVKYASYSGYNLKSGKLYSKRFYIKTIRQTKISRCMIECNKDQGCNSFDFNPDRKSCVLNTVTKFNVDDRLTVYKKKDHEDENSIHFVKYCKQKCKCGTFRPASKCICEGKGKLKRCYKKFSLREYYNKKDGRCAMRAKSILLNADCENPCVDQIDTKVCRKMKQEGKCTKDRETRLLCNKTCSHCICNKDYNVRIGCRRVKGKNRRRFERKIMNVKYRRSRCGLCTTKFTVKSFTCKPKKCYEQTVNEVGDCIAGIRKVTIQQIQLTENNECIKTTVRVIKHKCKGVCEDIEKSVSHCRYHKKEKKSFRIVTSSFWVSDKGIGEQKTYTRKYECSTSLCPKEITSKGPCLLGNRYKYHIYYILDYRNKCTKYVDAKGETCTEKKKEKKRCKDVIAKQLCQLYKNKNACYRHSGTSLLCAKTCGKCKRHATKLGKTTSKRAIQIIRGISTRYGGRYLEEVIGASIQLSKTKEGRKYIQTFIKIPGKGRRISRRKKNKRVKRKGKKNRKIRLSKKIKGNVKSKVTTKIVKRKRANGKTVKEKIVTTRIYKKKGGKWRKRKTFRKVYKIKEKRRPVTTKKAAKKLIKKIIQQEEDEDFEISGLETSSKTERTESSNKAILDKANRYIRRKNIRTATKISRKTTSGRRRRIRRRESGSGRSVVTRTRRNTRRRRVTRTSGGGKRATIRTRTTTTKRRRRRRIRRESGSGRSVVTRTRRNIRRRRVTRTSGSGKRASIRTRTTTTKRRRRRRRRRVAASGKSVVTRTRRTTRRRRLTRTRGSGKRATIRTRTSTTKRRRRRRRAASGRTATIKKRTSTTRRRIRKRVARAGGSSGSSSSRSWSSSGLSEGEWTSSETSQVSDGKGGWKTVSSSSKSGKGKDDAAALKEAGWTTTETHESYVSDGKGGMKKVSSKTGTSHSGSSSSTSTVVDEPSSTKSSGKANDAAALKQAGWTTTETHESFVSDGKGGMRKISSKTGTSDSGSSSSTSTVVDESSSTKSSGKADDEAAALLKTAGWSTTETSESYESDGKGGMKLVNSSSKTHKGSGHHVEGMFGTGK